MSLEEVETVGGTAVRVLHVHILEQVAALLKDLGLPSGDDGDGPNCNHPSGRCEPWVTIREAWANINAKGHRNHAHSHSTTTFAGCYYVASGFEGGSALNSTVLTLHKGPAGGDAPTPGNIHA